MISEKIIYIGVFINLICSLWYIRNIFYKNTKPNLVSFSIWAIAPFIGVYLQLKAGAGLSILGTFMAGLGPLLIVIFTLIKRNALWKLNRFDLVCGFFSILALMIYIVTNKLGISILFAIVSDGLAAFPTIRKSLKFPETETSLVYLGGIINNVLALLIVTNWVFSIYAFSIYLITINTIIVFSIYNKKILKLLNFRNHIAV